MKNMMSTFFLVSFSSDFFGPEISLDQTFQHRFQLALKKEVSDLRLRSQFEFVPPKICIFQNALTFLFFKVMRSKFEDFFVSSWNVHFWANKRIRARLGRAKVALSIFMWKIVILRFKSFSYPDFQTVQRTTKDQKSPEIDGAQFFLHRKKNSFELFLSAEKSQSAKFILYSEFPQVWDLLL